MLNEWYSQDDIRLNYLISVKSIYFYSNNSQKLLTPVSNAKPTPPRITTSRFIDTMPFMPPFPVHNSVRQDSVIEDELLLSL
jgi:hypothetical protein